MGADPLGMFGGRGIDVGNGNGDGGGGGGGGDGGDNNEEFDNISWLDKLAIMTLSVSTVTTTCGLSITEILEIDNSVIKDITSYSGAIMMLSLIYAYYGIKYKK